MYAILELKVIWDSCMKWLNFGIRMALNWNWNWKWLCSAMVLLKKNGYNCSMFMELKMNVCMVLKYGDD